MQRTRAPLASFVEIIWVRAKPPWSCWWSPLLGNIKCLNQPEAPLEFLSAEMGAAGSNAALFTPVPPQGDGKILTVMEATKSRVPNQGGNYKGSLDSFPRPPHPWLSGGQGQASVVFCATVAKNHCLRTVVFKS